MVQWVWTDREKALIEHLNKWTNHPSMSGTLLSTITLIIGKTTLLNLRILGLQMRVAPTISPIHLLSIADEIGIAIQELAARPEVRYVSQLHCVMLVLPAMLLHNVCSAHHAVADRQAHTLFGATELSRALDFCRDIWHALEKIGGVQPDLPIAQARHCYQRLHGAFEVHLRSATPKTASVSLRQF